MNQNICNICGDTYVYRGGRWVCPSCGAYKAEELSNEEVTLLYNAAQKLRFANFDEAEQAYTDIIEKFPQNPQGYWGRLLSKYGIKYEDDFDGRKIPTCYATSIESVVTDRDYLKAVALADSDTKKYYEEQAGYIERVRREWIEKAKREKPYDIFICYKDSDLANGIDRTRDSIVAQELYIHLTEQGYRVFFSRESLRDKMGEKYEPYIFNALSTAKIMLVYGSSAEYIMSTWLKNEWHRFYKKIVSGEKHPEALIVACDGFSPSELPSILSSRQCLDANRRTFFSDLDKFVKRIVEESKKTEDTKVAPVKVDAPLSGLHEHKYKAKVIEATCISKGYTLHQCGCGYSYKDNFTELTDHKFKILNSVEPDCHKGGFADKVCEICGEKTREILVPLGHAFSKWVEVKHPTCKEPGSRRRQCSRCGHAESEIINATGHQYGTWKTNSDGSQSRICRNCGETDTRLYDPDAYLATRGVKEKQKRKGKKATAILAILFTFGAVLAVSLRLIPWLISQTTPDNNDTGGNDSNSILLNECTLSFDANGGYGTMEDIKGEKGEEIILPKHSFSRYGYTFAGWGITPGGLTTVEDCGSITLNKSSITLYAIWEAKDPYYSDGLIYNSIGGGLYSVTGTENSRITDVVISGTYKGNSVTCIDSRFFANNTQIEKVTLNTNLIDNNTLTIPAGMNVIVDLGGNTLTTGYTDGTNGKHAYAFDVYGTLTIKNGTIDARGVQTYDGGKLIIEEGVTINAVDNDGGACIFVRKGSVVTINGGTFNSTACQSQLTGGSVIINDGGEVIINDGTFVSAVNGPYVINHWSGKTTLNGGTFKAVRGVVSAIGGTLNITGGTFTKTDLKNNAGYELYVAGSAKVTLTGGIFTNRLFSGTIIDNRNQSLSADKKAVHEMNTFIAMEEADTFEEALAALEKNKINTENLAPISAGYSFVWNSETNTIELVETKEDTVDIIESIKTEAITVSTSDYLTLAVANGSKNVTLGADLTVTSGVTALAGTEINLDLGGNTLSTGMADATKHHYAFNVYGTVTLTNGTVDARGIKIFDGGKLILGEGVTVNHVDDNGGACLWVYEGAEVVVDGGTFVAAKSKSTVATDPAVISNFGGKITINNGKFETTKSYAYAINNFSGDVVINGGEFSGYRGVISCNGGNVTINGGKFTVTGNHATDINVAYVVYASSGNVVINDGTFTGGAKTYCVDGSGTGSITLADGTKLTAGQSK